MNDIPDQPLKRRLLALLAGLPLLTACVSAEVRAARKAVDERGKAYHDTLTPNEQATLQRFQGIAIQLVVDAVAGAEMGGVKIYSDNGYSIFSAGSVALRKRSTLDVGSARVPLWVKVTWKKPIVVSSDWDAPIIGDYTIRVAERIPDEVVESLRKDPRGNLRIKFRLHPEGVYFGWEIERRPGYDPKKRDVYFPPAYEMTGGDFKEARPAGYVVTEKGLESVPDMPAPLSETQKAFLKKHHLYTHANGRVWEKGWYLDKSGQKRTEPIDCGPLGGIRDGDSTITCATVDWVK